MGGCARAASGMADYTVLTRFDARLVDKGVLSIERLVQLMCHNPAELLQSKIVVTYAKAIRLMS